MHRVIQYFSGMRISLLFFALLTAIPAMGQSDLQKGISWFGMRTDGAVGVKAAREPVEQAAFHLRRAMAEPHHELEAGLYLCRSLIFKGRFVETESKARSKALEEAKTVAEQLLKKYPNNRDVHFEHLAALGLWGESIGVLRAAKEGIVNRMKEACEGMIRLDPEFMNGVGKRSLAVLNYKVPSIPFILNWPDKKKSMAMLTEIMAHYPDDVANTFYYAEALYLNGKKDEAHEYLQKVLAFAPDREHLLEHRTFHIQAKQLLDKMKGK